MSPWMPDYLGGSLRTLGALPGANSQRSPGELQAEFLANQDRMKLADALASQGYVPNSGALGSIAQIFGAWSGNKIKKEEQKKLAELLREESDMLSAAERRKLEEKAQQDAAELKQKMDAAIAAGYSPGQAQAVARGIALPKPEDPYNQYLSSLSPEQRNQAYAVKAGLAARPGSGTNVTVKAPENDLMAAVAAGYISPQEAERVVRTQHGLALPLDKQAEADALAGKSAERASSAAYQANSVLDEIRSAREMVGAGTAGLGSVLSSVPGTKSRDLQAKLTTIKANFGFDRLQQMREESPTGGALGAVAVQELEALQSTVASLDQEQSPEQLQKALNKAERHYSRWLDIKSQAAQGQRPGEIIPNSQPRGGGSSGSFQTYRVGQVIEANGKRYRVVGGDPSDPDLEEVR